MWIPQFKRSLMQRLFTYGPGREPAETKETEIGEIPAHWEVRAVSDIAHKPQYGHTASATWSDTGVRFLRITDVTESGVLWSSVPFCECSAQDIDQYGLQSNGIVFARTGATTGKSFLVLEPPKSVFASYLIRLRLQPHFNPAFVQQYFNTLSYWKQLTMTKSGATQPGINGTRLAELLVPVTTQKEQEEVAAALSSADIKIAAEEDRKTTLEALFKSMLHQLMTGQIRLFIDEDILYLQPTNEHES